MAISTVGPEGLQYQAGNGPAFRAKLSSNQTITSGVATKVNLDTETYDTASCFSAGRFTPNVAGYYHITFNLMPEPSTNISRVIITPYVNGVITDVVGDFSNCYPYTVPFKFNGSDLYYMNGTTDYIEFYCYIFAATSIISSGNTFMAGFLARAA
jgi:hypothetical protein